MKLLRGLPTGTFAALATIAVLVVVMATSGNGMFSPGELNARSRTRVPLGGVSSHAEIGNNCAACHVSPTSKETMASRCTDCHADIRMQRDTQGPLHGNVANGMECRTCHTEHRGAHAALTSFAQFDHDCAAFKLTGKHVGIDCKSCHTSTAYK